MTLVLFVPYALACTCSQGPPGKCAGPQKDSAVFLGTVTAIEEIGYAPPSSSETSGPPVNMVASRLTRYRFQVEERFASTDSLEGSSTVDIFSGGQDGDCAYRFKPNEQYVVFAHWGADGRLFTTICSGTRPSSESRGLLPQLRAMRDGQRVASVFGVLRRADRPLLAIEGDPADPLPSIPLELRSRYDRFETNTDADGVFTFYDVHAGEYTLTARLPLGTELTHRPFAAGFSSFAIPDSACYEYDVDALPAGRIRGSVVGPDGKPLAVASLELYRAGNYSDSRAGLWGFQGAAGVFDFDNIGAGDYILVFNRANRIYADAPFRRAFYPGVTDADDAKPIRLKDGQQLLDVKLRVKDAYPNHPLRVRLKWTGARPPGEVSVAAKASEGESPTAQKLANGLYQFTLLDSASYTISASEDLSPASRPASRRRAASRLWKGVCPPPARLEASPVIVQGADSGTKEITLSFARPGCASQAH